MTTSSDDHAESKVQVLTLSSRIFEVLFQVAYQAAEFPDSRLEASGFTRADLNGLLAALGKIRDNMGDSPWVCIDFCDPSDAADLALEEYRVDICDEVVHGRLACELGICWNSLGGLVISGVSPRELYLRTGFDFDETLDAIGKLAAIETSCPRRR